MSGPGKEEGEMVVMTLEAARITLKTSYILGITENIISYLDQQVKYYILFGTLLKISYFIWNIFENIIYSWNSIENKISYLDQHIKYYILFGTILRMLYFIWNNIEDILFY